MVFEWLWVGRGAWCERVRNVLESLFAAEAQHLISVCRACLGGSLRYMLRLILCEQVCRPRVCLPPPPRPHTWLVQRRVGMHCSQHTHTSARGTALPVALSALPLRAFLLRQRVGRLRRQRSSSPNTTN